MTDRLSPGASALPWAPVTGRVWKWAATTRVDMVATGSIETTAKAVTGHNDAFGRQQCLRAAQCARGATPTTETARSKE